MTMTINLLRKAWQFNRLITLAGLLHIMLIPLLLVCMAIDPKVITGANAWIKPLKFAISAPFYSFTITWLLTYIQGRRRLVQTIANAIGVIVLIETLLIVLQVLRNTSSHFNLSTPFNAAVFSIMATAITILALMNLATVILLCIQRLDNRLLATAIRFGALISFAGMMVAFLMTSGPTPSQRADLEAGGKVTTVGAHSVGIEDGGPGLPLVGWSAVGGDLRVPHFVGLHGLQLLPLLGFLLTRHSARRRYREGQRASFVWTAGLGYLGWVGILTWQALRGESIVTMDLQTGLAYLILIGSMAITLSITLLSSSTARAEVTNALPTQ